MSGETVAPLWKPSPQRVANSRLADLTAILARRTGRPVTDFATVHRLSVDEPEVFWGAVWDDCGVIAGNRGDVVLAPGASLRETRWFPDARLNYAENLMRRRDEGPAMIAAGESGASRSLSWQELHDLVSRLQRALLRVGVGPRDRVAAWLPDICEAHALMLAATSLGAVFCAAPAEMPARAVATRLARVAPKVLVVADGHRRAGSRVEMLGDLPALMAALPSTIATVVVPRLDPELTLGVDGVVTLPTFTEEIAPGPVTFERLGFDHPVLVLFAPFGDGFRTIVHRAGGALLKHLVEHQYHCDVRSGDRVLHPAPVGDVMWHWVGSALASGATLVLFDGDPVLPDPRRPLDLVAELEVTLFGAPSPWFEQACRAGLVRADDDLAALRTIIPTGPPLSRECGAFVYSNLRRHAHLAALWGGADVCGALVAGDPTGVVWPGELQGPALGVALDVVGDDGRTVPPGRRGHVIVRDPFPTVPLGFWEDDDGTAFSAAYFDRFDGMWCRGDAGAWTEHGGIVLDGVHDDPEVDR